MPVSSLPYLECACPYLFHNFGKVLNKKASQVAQEGKLTEVEGLESLDHWHSQLPQRLSLGAKPVNFPGPK
jgi:hypothetical protein